MFEIVLQAVTFCFIGLVGKFMTNLDKNDSSK